MKVTLKDGSSKEYSQAMSIIDIAKDISEGLARVACVAELDGEVVDLRTIVDGEHTLNILTFDSDEGKAAFRHTASHVLAQAIKRLYPDAKCAIGPSIEEGFYYDFDIAPLDREALDKIEKEMKKIVKEGATLERFTLPRQEAIDLMRKREEPYKVELIEDLPEDAEISFYQQGEYIDLCAGPHLMNTKPLKAMKLISSSGAYWRGNEKNKMLTRVYGTAYTKKADLDAYLEHLEDIKKRDHNKLGRELELFTTVDVIGQGLPLLMPKGVQVIQTLQRWIEDEEEKRGYMRTKTPLMAKSDLYKISGHWDHYKDNMFPAMEVEGESFVLRPMNCPHHMMIYANKMHSYKDLPIRIGEIAHDFRFEASGTLKGIERGRHFCQNDAHLFVTPEQIESEFKQVVDLIFDTYKDFNITDYRCVLVKYHDDDEMWNTAEDALRKVLDDIGIEYTEEIGEAAFYGPKLDVNVKPAIGNEYTLSTCQLDFCLPAKFNLTYIDKDGTKKTPVVLHRAILGSLDRFMAYILEETKGNLPLWLAPVQARILPVKNEDEELNAYAHELYDFLDDNNIRVEIDERAEKLGYRVRAAQVEKVPYLIILGKNEVNDKTVSYRLHGEQKTTTVPMDEFLAMLQDEIKTKKLNPAASK